MRHKNDKNAFLASWTERQRSEESLCFSFLERSGILRYAQNDRPAQPVILREQSDRRISRVFVKESSYASNRIRTAMANNGSETLRLASLAQGDKPVVVLNRVPQQRNCHSEGALATEESLCFSYPAPSEILRWRSEWQRETLHILSFWTESRPGGTEWKISLASFPQHLKRFFADAQNDRPANPVIANGSKHGNLCIPEKPSSSCCVNSEKTGPDNALPFYWIWTDSNPLR